MLHFLGPFGKDRQLELLLSDPAVGPAIHEPEEYHWCTIYEKTTQDPIKDEIFVDLAKFDFGKKTYLVSSY